MPDDDGNVIKRGPVVPEAELKQAGEDLAGHAAAVDAEAAAATAMETGDERPRGWQAVEGFPLAPERVCRVREREGLLSVEVPLAAGAGRSTVGPAALGEPPVVAWRGRDWEIVTADDTGARGETLRIDAIPHVPTIEE